MIRYIGYDFEILFCSLIAVIYFKYDDAFY